MRNRSKSGRSSGRRWRSETTQKRFALHAFPNGINVRHSNYDGKLSRELHRRINYVGLRVDSHVDGIRMNLDTILLLLAFISAVCGYHIGKTVVDDDLKADVEQLLKQNESQREIIKQLGLSQTRTSGNHPAGRALRLVRE